MAKEKKSAVKDTDAALDVKLKRNLVKGLLCVLEIVQQWMWMLFLQAL